MEVAAFGAKSERRRIEGAESPLGLGFFHEQGKEGREQKRLLDLCLSSFLAENTLCATANSTTVRPLSDSARVLERPAAYSDLAADVGGGQRAPCVAVC